jgi:nucleolin
MCLLCFFFKNHLYRHVGLAKVSKKPVDNNESSDSSDTEKPSKPVAKPAKAVLGKAASKVTQPKPTSGKAPPSKAPPPKAAAAAGSSEESSEESSEDESSEDAPAKPVSAKPSAKVSTVTAESSDEESSEEESSEDAPAKPVSAKPAAKVSTVTKPTLTSPATAKGSSVKAGAKSKSSSSEDSSEESSDEDSGKAPSTSKPVAKNTLSRKESSDSEESSDPEPGVKVAKKENSSESEDSASDSEDSEEDEDVDMADASTAPALVPTNGLIIFIRLTRFLIVFYLHTGKRKADTETAAPLKKTKLANGDGVPPDNTDKDTSATTVFVGHLSWNVDSDWLKSEFEECGEIVSARVQMDRNTGKSRGFAYVEFSDPASVEKALKLSGKEIDGRAVNVDRSTSNKSSGAGNTNEQRRAAFGDKTSPPSTVLFVGNLSWGADENSLWDMFAEYGDVKSVRVPTDRESGKAKGFAYVEFSDIEASKKAFTGAQGVELQGRNLRLDYSQPREDGGGGRGGARGGRGFDRGSGGGRGGFGGGRGGFGGGRGGGRGGFGGGRGGFGGGRGGFDGGRVSTWAIRNAISLLTIYPGWARRTRPWRRRTDWRHNIIRR